MPDDDADDAIAAACGQAECKGVLDTAPYGTMTSGQAHCHAMHYAILVPSLRKLRRFLAELDGMHEHGQTSKTESKWPWEVWTKSMTWPANLHMPDSYL